MNITKKVKIMPEKSIQSKPSFLIISTNFQLETLYHILIKNPSLVNTKDAKGETFLSYAIKRKNIETSELIITSPILDYNFQDKNGNSYLHLAVINCLENIAKALIEKGININLQNNEGNTALHFAYSTGDIKLIKLVIESKADFTIKNKKGLIGEEIKKGTFQEILDVSNSKSITNIIINPIISDNKNISKEININSENEIKIVNNSNNEIIQNEKNQINKSINMNWENNGNNDDRIINNNIINTSNNVNQSGSQQNSKLKFSLVNFSYSEDPDEIDDKKINNQENPKISEIKNSIQSSDIFDLCSSATYQEKLANINKCHIVEEPKIISKKESSESNTNDDIVNININRFQTSNQNNNLIQNGNQISQISFLTSYENGRKINDNNNNENGLNIIKSLENKNELNMNTNGGKIIQDFCKSLTKEEILQNKVQYIKKESEGSSIDINQSNNIQSKVDTNDNFAFSPLASLKKTLNNKLNGSEININSLNNINSSNLSNMNINNELKKQENQIIMENKTINISSPIINKYNPNKENYTEIQSQKSKMIPEINSRVINNKNKKNNFHHINTNLSEANLNNISTKKNTKINLDCPINTSEETTISSQKPKSNDDYLYKFLSEIRLENYYSIMKSNGFDDIQLLLNQTKTGIAITDKQLKLSGIMVPGDRAKILIRLQEKAGHFSFPVPKEVYYINQNDDYNDDKNINNLKNWLEEIKVENYLENFIKNGYHSIELMMLQMESKNPITDEILKDEIGIEKIGHRSRIINKLNEDAKSTYNKWKKSVLIIGADLTKKICDCNIF